MNKNVLRTFETWFADNETRLKETGLSFTLTYSPESSNRSVYADFDCEKYVGRVTCWSSGDCDQEIVCVASEETILWKHEVAESPEKLAVLLENFCVQLSS